MRLSVLFIFSLIMITGCASTSLRKQDAVLLDSRLDSVNKKLDNHDVALQDLKNDLEDIRLSMSEKRAYKNISLRSSQEESSLSVKQIQRALTRAGHYNGKIDGVIGTKTDQAVRSFQRSNKIKVDGKVGKETSQLLKKYLE